MTLILSFFLFNWVTSCPFICYFLLSLFFKKNFILKLNRIDLLNIGGCSFHFFLFDLVWFSEMLLQRSMWLLLMLLSRIFGWIWIITSIFFFFLWWAMSIIEWQWVATDLFFFLFLINGFTTGKLANTIFFYGLLSKLFFLFWLVLNRLSKLICFGWLLPIIFS